MLKNMRRFRWVLLLAGITLTVSVMYGVIGNSSRVAAEALGESTAKRYIELPSSVQKKNFYFYEMGQGRSDYIRFELSSDELTSFLQLNCFHNLQNLTKTDDPPPPSDEDLLFGDHLPEWWRPNEAKSWIGNSCEQKGVGLRIWVAESNNGSVIYLYLGIP